MPQLSCKETEEVLNGNNNVGHASGIEESGTGTSGPSTGLSVVLEQLDITKIHEVQQESLEE
jgi:hypothetical protein